MTTTFEDYLASILESKGPDAVYEQYEEEVEAQHVWLGDQLVNNAHLSVKRKKTGTKWTELFHMDDSRIMRVLNDTTLTVSRRKQTDESRRADKLFDATAEIASWFSQDVESVRNERLARLNEHVKQGYVLRYDVIGDLLQADANLVLAVQKREAIRYQWEKDGTDLYTAYFNYIDELKDDLTQPHGGYRTGISRSTNQVDNLMDDIRIAATQAHIYESKWVRVR